MTLPRTVKRRATRQRAKRRKLQRGKNVLGPIPPWLLLAMLDQVESDIKIGATIYKQLK